MEKDPYKRYLNKEPAIIIAAKNMNLKQFIDFLMEVERYVVSSKLGRVENPVMWYLFEEAYPEMYFPFAFKPIIPDIYRAFRKSEQRVISPQMEERRRANKGPAKYGFVQARRLVEKLLKAKVITIKKKNEFIH